MNRTFTFAHKYFDGKIPELGPLGELDTMLQQKLNDAPEALGKYIDTYQFKAYIRELMDLARFANKYFNDKEPWKTRNDDIASCGTTINLCLQTIHTLSVLAEPVLPFTARKLWKMLNVDERLSWDTSATDILKAGHSISKAEILFSKLEDSHIQPEIDRLKQALEGPEEPVEETELIGIEDFAKVQLRVAEIVQAEKIKKSDKLLKLQVSLGNSTRQIVAGIAQNYNPQDLIGKKVVVVANLKPAKLRGNLSEGMLLAASSDEQLTLLTIMDDLPSGSKIS